MLLLFIENKKRRSRELLKTFYIKYIFVSSNCFVKYFVTNKIKAVFIVNLVPPEQITNFIRFWEFI